MLHHLNATRSMRTIRPVSHAILIAVALNAGAAFADGPTIEDRAKVGAATGGVGLVGGALTGAGAGWAYDKLNPMTAAQIKDAAGRKPDSSGFYKDMSPAERARHQDDVARAKSDLAKKQMGNKRIDAHREAKFEARANRLGRRNPDLAKDLRKQHQQGMAFNKERSHALKLHKGKEIQPAILDNIGKDDAARRARLDDRLGFDSKTKARMERQGAAAHKRAGTAARKGAKSAKNGAKALKTGKKMGRVARGAVGGGAAGMVAGAALGVTVPDAVDVAMFGGKLLSDPKNADKTIAQAGKDGLEMAGTALTTVTNPAKMVRNLGNAAKGVGETVQGVGDAIGVKGVFRGKGSVRAHVDANGKCTTNSIWYRCKLQNARNRRTASSGRTTYVFKPDNPASRMSTSLSSGGRSVARTYNRGTRYIDRGVSRAAHNARRSFDRHVHQTYRPATKYVGRHMNRHYGAAERKVNGFAQSAYRSVERHANRSYRSASRHYNKAKRSVGRTARSFGRGLKKTFRFK